MSDDSTPPNIDLLVYKIDELREGQKQMHDMFSEFMSSFNNHIREDTIMAEQVKSVRGEVMEMKEERKSNAGIWSGIAGAATGIGAFIYAIFGGK
jgi:hypothetical protein